MVATSALAAAFFILVPAYLGVHVQDLAKSRQPHKEISPERLKELEKEWRHKHNITAPKVNKKLKSGRTGSQAVIIQANRKDQPVSQYMYEPFVQTLADGFSFPGTFTVTIEPPTLTYRSTLETTLTSLVAGDILVFVGGIGKGTFLDVMYTNATAVSLARQSSSASAAQFRETAKRYNFSALKRSGVSVIFYNTDAAFECPLTSADPVTELWDYSHHNIDVCQDQGNGPTTIRYVPPGFLSTQSTTPLNGPHGALFHLGHAWWRTCWLELYNAMPGEVAFESSAWTSDAMSGILKHNNIFVNLHKGDCRWSINPFAAARVSRLLSAGGVIVSERAYSKDETAFAGLVDFVEFDAIPATYADYYSKTIPEFDTNATSKRTTFSQYWSPSVIFTNASIYADLMGVP